MVLVQKGNPRMLVGGMDDKGIDPETRKRRFDNIFTSTQYVGTAKEEKGAVLSY